MPNSTEHTTNPAIGALKNHPLCVVAHRVPFHHDDTEGWQRSPSGLVRAVGASGGRWFGYAPEHNGGRSVERDPSVVLDIDEQTHTEAIDGCCNRTLWPALHGVSGNIEESADWWRSYFRHNDRTATEVACRAPAGALIWVHDYHYFAVARELKRRRRDLRVGLFCHTAVDARQIASLSRGHDLLRAMSSFDMIGTQTERDADALRRQFDRLEIGANVPIRPAPVGIDVDTWSAFREDPKVERAARRHRSDDGWLVVGIDRADYTKGVVAKLLAIEIVLSNGSVTPDEVRLVQIATPTRRGIAAYDHVLDETQNIAARINRSFSRSDGLNVVEVHTDPRPPVEVAALMRAADVMLINPIRDGMGLVALESSVVNADRPTEVILSRGAGASEYIGEHCRLVDGADVVALGDALSAVIREPDDETQRLDRARQRASAAGTLSAQDWVATNSRRLAACDLHHPISQFAESVTRRR